MKISILGTNGFLSTAIAQYANQQNWELHMYGLTSPQDHEYDMFFRIDIANSYLDYSNILSSDIIVYAIGAGIQSNLNEGTDLIYQLNVSIPVSICCKLNELSYKGTFVTFGSFFEIGESSEECAYSENKIITSQCIAPNDYTVSKRMLTRFVSSYKPSFRHWHFIIPTIYGAGENPQRLIPYIINAIRNNQDLHFTSGEQVRQYIHVSEIPRLLNEAYNNSLESGIYNVEGKETLKVKEIVELIHNTLGKNIPENCFGRTQRNDVGMHYLALDGHKLKESIGFTASICIKNIIHTY